MRGDRATAGKSNSLTGIFMKTLTSGQAYQAMLEFLEGYQGRTNSEELGSLLGGFLLLEDGSPADPAAWQDWEEAVRRVLNSENDPRFKLTRDT